MDLKEIMAKAMNVEPILDRSTIKAIVIANITNTLAINSAKGRTVFMSSLAKDIVAANGMAAGGMDINSLIMMSMMEEKTEAPKQIEGEVSLSDIAKGLKSVVSRLEVIEAEFVEAPAGKEVG